MASDETSGDPMSNPFLSYDISTNRMRQDLDDWALACAAVGNDKLRLAVAVGGPGIGKSEARRKALVGAKLRPTIFAPDADTVHDELAKHRKGCVLVQADHDKAFASGIVVNALKHAFDDAAGRIVPDTRKGHKPFAFASSLLIETNRDITNAANVPSHMREHIEALLSRAEVVVKFTSDRLELYHWTSFLATRGGQILKQHDLTLAQSNEILAFLAEHLWRLPEVSPRKIVHWAKNCRAYPHAWQRWARKELLPPGDYPPPPEPWQIVVPPREPSSHIEPVRGWSRERLERLAETAQAALEDAETEEQREHARTLLKRVERELAAKPEEKPEEKPGAKRPTMTREELAARIGARMKRQAPTSDAAESSVDLDWAMTRLKAEATKVLDGTHFGQFVAQMRTEAEKVLARKPARLALGAPREVEAEPVKAAANKAPKAKRAPAETAEPQRAQGPINGFVIQLGAEYVRRDMEVRWSALRERLANNTGVIECGLLLCDKLHDAKVFSSQESARIFARELGARGPRGQRRIVGMLGGKPRMMLVDDGSWPAGWRKVIL
jgi:hypothetical protein